MDRRMEELTPTVDGMSELAMKLITHSVGSFAINACMLLWQIWKNRNIMTFESTRRPPAHVVCTATTVIAEWNQSQMVGNADGTKNQCMRSICGA